MREIFRLALHSRNVPVAERLLRVGMALALASLPWFHRMSPWAAGSVWASALFVAATGFVGFCPACYLVGRRMLARKT